MPPVKTALVHDWLTSKGGAEKVLDAIHALYPGPVHVLVKDGTQDKEVHASFIQRLPFARKAYRNYLPFFPLAIEQFDLSEYDLILSSSHAVAKNVLTHAGQLHICYCHTPMRYAWDLYHPYVQDLSFFKKLYAQKVLHSIRTWDHAGASRVDHFIANSRYIARRIKKVYNRDAAVIYPPVATHLFSPSANKENFYLTVSRLVPYKRIDLIVKAFAQMPEKKLVVIGDGPEMAKIKQYATPNIELLGACPDNVMRATMSKARAFVFAAEEDFGIAPVEAQAAGTPVIAYGRGGVLETVKEGVTGLFFDEQSVASLCEAIASFEQRDFDPSVIRAHAETFNESRFQDEYRNFVETKMSEFYESHHPCRR